MQWKRTRLLLLFTLLTVELYLTVKRCIRVMATCWIVFPHPAVKYKLTHLDQCPYAELHE